MMDKLKVAVLFGGQSSEHEISEMSAVNILNNMDWRIEPYMVGITKEGRWYLYEGHIDSIKDCGWEKSPYKTPAMLSPDASIGGLLVLRDGKYERVEIDAVFPALHGRFGEDGTIQGLCSLAHIPYVGPDMLSSGICMDKTIAKIMFKHLNIPQADWITILSSDIWDEVSPVMDRIEAKLSYPVFVKPARAGSSVGIGKAKNREQLAECLYNAADNDTKVLVEEFIKGREIECAAFGNQEFIVAEPGEIISANEFYDFESKYKIKSTINIPAPIPEAQLNKVKQYAKTLYEGIGLSGMSRLDFFVADDGEVYINEINTLPGFTDISMYPKMMEHMGYSQSDLVYYLVSLAIDAYIDLYYEDLF